MYVTGYFFRDIPLFVFAVRAPQKGAPKPGHAVIQVKTFGIKFRCDAFQDLVFFFARLARAA
jgi:hypothetical protein